MSITNTLKTAASLFVVFFLSSFQVQSQDQIGLPPTNVTAGFLNYMPVYSFKILDDPLSNLVDQSCNTAFKYTVAFDYSGYGGGDLTAPWSGSDTSYWASLPGGSGRQSFTAQVTYHIWANNNNSRTQPLAWRVSFDGVYCDSCKVAVTLDAFFQCVGDWTQTLVVEYPDGESWDNDGVRDIILEPVFTGENYDCNRSCSWCDRYGYKAWTHTNQKPQIRFNAVMVNTTTTDAIGTFTTPIMPVTILRDPPGDHSYGYLEQSSTQRYGMSISTGTSFDRTQWKETKLGVAYSVGLPGVSVDVEAYNQSGTSASYSYGGEYNQELEITFTNTSEFKTPQTGPPDDLYLFSAVEYVYGYQKTIHRESCQVIAREGLMMVPIGQTSYYYRESLLKSTHLPNAQAKLASLTNGPTLADSIAYHNAAQQVSVFEQALAMNADIKAEAVYHDQIYFDPGITVHTDLTTSSVKSKEITTSVILSNGLSSEHCVAMGGSSVISGHSINMGVSFGSGQNSTLGSSSTVGYHLEDLSSENVDQFYVKLMKDEVFGSNVYLLDSALSRTSCPYEGGYQIDQPQMWTGAINQTEMETIGTTVGSPATFKVYYCNNSDQPMDYELSINPSSNPNNATISASGGLKNGASVPVSLGANTCDSVTVFLFQIVADILDYENIELVLSSVCDENISSSALISAHFGCAMPGCTNISACNYDPLAECDDKSCEYLTCRGCTGLMACNFDTSAKIDDNSCEYGSCKGCTYADAANYDASKNIDDGTCEFPLVASSCSTDLDGNNNTDVSDLLTMLTAFGAACP